MELTILKNYKSSITSTTTRFGTETQNRPKKNIIFLWSTIKKIIFFYGRCCLKGRPKLIKIHKKNYDYSCSFITRQTPQIISQLFSVKPEGCVSPLRPGASSPINKCNGGNSVGSFLVATRVKFSSLAGLVGPSQRVQEKITISSMTKENFYE